MVNEAGLSFVTIQNNIVLKPNSRTTSAGWSFVTIQNNIVLKQIEQFRRQLDGFVTIQNNIVLKLNAGVSRTIGSLLPFKITLF